MKAIYFTFGKKTNIDKLTGQEFLSVRLRDVFYGLGTERGLKFIDLYCDIMDSTNNKDFLKDKVNIDLSNYLREKS